jgi:uncharacterized membrane protein
MQIYLLITLTGIFWGLGPVFDKTALKYFSEENALLIRVLTSAVLISIFAVIFGHPQNILSEYNWRGLIAIILSGIVGFAGVYTFYRVISIPGASISTNYAVALAICPIVTAIGANIFYGETLFEKAKIIGILLICTGIFLVSSNKS